MRSERRIPLPIAAALADFRDRLAGVFAERVETLRLYGSWANGEAHADSDVDVAVVVHALSPKERRRIYELAYETYERFLIDISPLALSSDEWADGVRRRARLGREIAQKGVQL